MLHQLLLQLHHLLLQLQLHGFFSGCTASSPAPLELSAKMTPPQFYKVAWCAFLIGGLTSRSSPELTETAPPPEESPEEEADEDAGGGLLDLPELSLLDSCQCRSMLLPLRSNARTVTVLSPSKWQQSISPS